LPEMLESTSGSGASRRAKVFIALPAYRQTNFTKTTSCLVNTALMLHANGWWGGFGDCSGIGIADMRNRFLTMWYDGLPECTHLLMVDDDMGWSFKMVADMIMVDKPIVGCIYPKKVYPIEYVGSLDRDQTGVPQGFKRATGLGGGVLLIRRDAVTKIMESDPSIVDYNIARFTAGRMLTKFNITRLINAFKEIENEQEIISEDISFCRRAQAAGVEMYASVAHKVTHVGAHEFECCFGEDLIPVEFAA